MRAIAERIGVPPGHLARALTGRVRPNETVRERLPEFLGVPLEQLFTAEVLSQPYYYGRGKYPRHVKLTTTSVAVTGAARPQDGTR